jgi:hypothetical protein
MITSNKKILFKSIVGIIILAALLVVLPNKAFAAVDPSNIMSDSVFENTDSMTVNQINGLINKYSSSCVGGKFTTADPHGWSTSTNQYVYGGDVSAGQAINSIALNYHLNPQVLIATLQKEQTIISGSAGCFALPNPSTSQPNVGAPNLPDYRCGNSSSTSCTLACTQAGGCMNIAMSYGCPWYCNVHDEGFSLQLTLGSWLLRFSEKRAYGIVSGYQGYEPGDQNLVYSGPMTAGYRKRFASDSTNYYDGRYTTIDGVSTTISNGATASLYTYTPFFNGNNNFVSIFQNAFGFGSTLAGNCIGTESPLPYVERYYNPKTFEHFYSAYSCDTTFLDNIGYINEGPVFNTTPSTASYAVPVYRYYNPSTGQHMWTTSNETQAQLDIDGGGYKVEAGIVFYVAQSGMPGLKPINRFYNPKTYLHIWVADPTSSDINFLTNKAGYSQNEGPAFYSQ